MPAYYNENDPKAAAWLRELIKCGHIADGEVDERSIVDVRPDELAGFTQCHFFAGIGGWSYALRLAGWPDDRPVWTGSCPCQPFSVAGKQGGTADKRHLWPEFFRLIAERKPPVVFGEQVASKAGRGWLAGVRADLEGMGYGVGAADLCAAGIGAPHIRQRLWWVADRETGRRDKVDSQPRGRDERGATEGGERPERGSGASGLADAGHEPGWLDTDQDRPVAKASGDSWSNSVWIPCADGKSRRIESGLEPLAHGIPARLGRLRGYGNAIVPQVAAAFIRATMP
jgi:DNA (cytosine-5)-methyltransferase 1